MKRAVQEGKREREIHHSTGRQDMSGVYLVFQDASVIQALAGSQKKIETHFMH